MKAAYINQTGPAENIIVGQLPDPTPTGSQVLVRMRAASVNPIDTYVRSGLAAPPNMPLPFIIGSDLAGVIAAVGPQAKKLKAGDRVWGANQGILGRQGTFSELAAIDESWLYAMPEHVSDEQAAALALVGITSHVGLVEHAHLQPGETVLVNGGSGGVGSTVIQMARAIGATVIATTSGPEKMEYCRTLGANHVLDYRHDDVPKRVAELTGGVDVWWETSWMPNFDAIFASMKHRGRVILIAGRTSRVEFPVGAFYTKCLSLHGFAMFLTPVEVQRQAAEQIGKWLDAGKLHAKIDRVASLDDAAELHRLQEASDSGAIRGKLVVKI
ncbi:NADPH:quinone reductase [Lacipirellula limnantheis]|uniref:Quinone oxidoreductase 1 n=1 Tax=Lacipirellula limnantheis TaxID=2528024 RepID=A0A517U5R9_9BACT|nr:NADPH:quinone reductase [Lacipirellula limnantheis]QDT75974.1 Quinone oxidoreductase 1 [Lacipirellula limnantheis]